MAWLVWVRAKCQLSVRHDVPSLVDDWLDLCLVQAKLLTLESWLIVIQWYSGPATLSSTTFTTNVFDQRDPLRSEKLCELTLQAYSAMMWTLTPNSVNVFFNSVPTCVTINSVTNYDGRPHNKTEPLHPSFDLLPLILEVTQTNNLQRKKEIMQKAQEIAGKVTGGAIGTKLPTRKLGKNGPNVTALGYGTMGLSAFYGAPKPDPERFAVLDKAYNEGELFWDTADMYMDSEDLLGMSMTLSLVDWAGSVSGGLD